MSYALSDTAATISPEITSSDPTQPIDVVVRSGFLAPAGAPAQTRLDGMLIDTFSAGERRVYFGLESGDVLEVSLAPAPVPMAQSPFVALVLQGGALAAVALRRLR